MFNSTAFFGRVPTSPAQAWNPMGWFRRLRW